MDIEILLALQAFREILGSLFERFCLLVTHMGSGVFAVFVVLAVYVRGNKRLAAYLTLTLVLGFVSTQSLKHLVACPRPWLRDDRIHPLKAALAGASGYSFPSGHTQNAMSLFGGVLVGRRRTHDARGTQHDAAIKTFCSLAVLLVGLSRCVLGVHTPQDVLAGFVVGWISLWTAHVLMDQINSRVNPTEGS